MKFKALGCICIIEIAGTIGAVMKNPAAAGICLTGTCFLTGYTAYLHMMIMHIFTYMHYLLVLYVQFERLHLVTSFIYSFSEICHLIPLRM